MISQAFLFECIGYAASIFVAISFMTRTMIKLRAINAIGAILFIVYGLLIKAYPVVIINCFITVIHFYHLGKMLKK